MKLKQNFITHTHGDEHILISTGNGNFSGVVRSNSTAAFIIEQLKEDTTLDAIIDAMLLEYEVDRDQAAQDAAAVIEKLRSIGAIEG